MKQESTLQKRVFMYCILIIALVWMVMPNLIYPFSILKEITQPCSWIHQEIVHEALKRLGGFSNTAIQSLECHSADPDPGGWVFGYPHYDEYHFLYKDNPTVEENWRMSVGVMNNNRSNARWMVYYNDKELFYENLGVLFHTIADHHSHTNWVEHSNKTIDGLDLEAFNPPTLPDGAQWANIGNESKDSCTNVNHSEAVEDAISETIREWYKIEKFIFENLSSGNDVLAKTYFNNIGVSPGFNFISPIVSSTNCGKSLVGEPVLLKWHARGIRPETPFTLWLSKTVNGQNVLLGKIATGIINHSWKPFTATWLTGSYLNENGDTCWINEQEYSLQYKLIFISKNDWETCEFLLPEMSSVEFTMPNVDSNKWQIGAIKAISWKAINYSGIFSLSLKKDGDRYSESIDNNINVMEGMGSYNWQVGMTTSGISEPGVYSIQLIENNLLGCHVCRYANLLITYFDITSPPSNAQLQLGTTQSIKWSSPLGKTDLVKLLLYQGSTLKGTIAENLAANGSFGWTVGNYAGGTAAAGSNYNVRIQTMDGANFTDSDAFFLVAAPTATITLTDPNGGETWEAGSSQNITWSSTGTVGNVKIEYSKDGGATWTVAANGGSQANDGTYAWTVPAGASSSCKVRVSEAADGSPSDVSDGTFSLIEAPAIVVTSPNGGETWEAGSSQNITWSSTGTVGNVKIEYSKDGGSTWTVALNGASQANDGSYAWTVPAGASSTCKVRVSEAADGSPSDASDANFAISETAQPTVTVVKPNGGEWWKAGSTQNITWSWTGAIGSVKIEYTSNGGTTWNTVAASAANSGSYGWLVPNDLSASCKVRVSGNGTDAVDASNNTFNITDKSITVTSPNTAVQWTAGTTQPITWTSTGGVGNVKIEYTSNGGSTWNAIVASTANSGSYSWLVPNDPSSQCLVRVSEAATPAIKDSSNVNFSIVTAPKSIIVTAHNGGLPDWKLGTSQNITWTATGLSGTVEISLWQNGVNKGVIAASVSATAGSYAWVVGSGLTEVVTGTGCKIQVKENGGTTVDSSDNSFTISF